MLNKPRSAGVKSALDQKCSCRSLRFRLEGPTKKTPSKLLNEIQFVETTRPTFLPTQKRSPEFRLVLFFEEIDFGKVKS